MLYMSVYLLVYLSSDMNKAFISCLLFQVLKPVMRGITENLRNLLLCHQIKEKSVFAGAKPSVEMGNNNLTRDKGIACPPTTFVVVVVVVVHSKNMNDKDSPQRIFSVRWRSSLSVRSASSKTWTEFTSSERLRSRPR